VYFWAVFSFNLSRINFPIYLPEEFQYLEIYTLPEGFFDRDRKYAYDLLLLLDLMVFLRIYSNGLTYGTSGRLLFPLWK